MGNINEEAKAYVPQQMKNIADLEVVNTTLDVKEETFGEGNDSFTAKFVEVNDEKYRIPISVLKSLKAILIEKPDLTTFKVVKTGSGMSTEYTVIPLG